MFACIRQTGYVGVGVVEADVVPAKDFCVQVDGYETPILEAPLEAPNPHQYADDPDKSEYYVKIGWVRTVSKDDAIWENGMFANQNSACRLRNKFTIERLTQRFGLLEE